jgi:hypothetical protein
MGLDAQHTTHDEMLDRSHPVVMDRLDLRSSHRQALLDLLNVEIGIAVFP